MTGKDMAVILTEVEVGLGEAVEVTSPVTTVAEGAAVTEEEERERERGEEEEEDHQEDQESQNETGTGFALIQDAAM